MQNLKHITVMILALGLMGLLGLIVFDEFMMANAHGGQLDSQIVELLQMSITGCVGIIAGYVTSRDSKGCGSDSCKCK